MTKNENKTIILHDVDADGMTAAAMFGGMGMYYTYYGIRRNKLDEAVEVCKCYDYVYVLDFCFNVEQYHKILEAGSKVVVFDHHKTAVWVNHPNFEFHHCTGICTAMLVWKNQGCPSKWERVAKLVNDYDMWEHKIADTRAFVITVETYCKSHGPDYVRSLVDSDTVQTAITKGQAMLAYRQGLIDEHRERIVVVGDTAWVNVSCYSLVNDISEALKNQHKVIVCWYMRENREVKLSFRSKDVDVSVIAQEFGGGGHKNAAGCSCNISDLFTALAND